MSMKSHTGQSKNKKNKKIIDVHNMLPDKQKKINEVLDDQESTNETLKKSFLKHLEMTFNVSESLKRAGLSSKKYNLFLENDEGFNQSVQDLTNTLIDIAQSKLLKLITIDPVWIDSDGIPQKHPACSEFVKATTFLLDRLGASRGWNGESVINKQKIDNKIEVYVHTATPEMTQEIINAQN